MPYMSLTFLTFEEYRASLLSMGAPKQAATLAAGSLGGVTAVVLTYPLDLVRATMATKGCTHTGMGDALVSIYKQRGLPALYSGVSATCIGVAPYAGLKFVSYEALKGCLAGLFGMREEELKPWQRLGSGLLAGWRADLCLSIGCGEAADADGHWGAYASTLDALTTIAQRRYSQGLYRGLGLNYLKTMPNVAIYMSLYDIVKIQWGSGVRRSSGRFSIVEIAARAHSEPSDSRALLTRT